MKNRILFLLLTGCSLVTACRLSGWNGTDHQLMLQQARTRMPLELRLLFKETGAAAEFAAAWDRGAVKPDRELHDYVNHVWHVKPDKKGRRYGKAPQKVKREVQRIVSRVNASVSLTQLALDMGTASHYVADINNPLHTATDPKEKKMHSRFERNYASRGKKEWRFDGYDYYPSIDEWIMKTARRSNRHYQTILDAYQDEGFRRVADTAHECYEHGINDIVDLFYNVYRRCGSLLYNYQKLQESGFKLNLNSASAAELSQIYYISERLANRLVRYREKHNGFKSLDESLRVRGMSRKRLKRIAFLLTVN